MNQEYGPIFIATSFAKCQHAEQLADILGESGFQCQFGKYLGGNEISTGVRARISSSSCLIALLERAHKKSRKPSSWVVQEMVFAYGCGKKCLLLEEESVRFPKGLLGDVEVMSFNAANFTSVVPQVLRQLKVLLLKEGLTIGIKKNTDRWFHVSTELDNDCNDGARESMRQSGILIEKSDFDRALEYARKAARLDRKCWQARLRCGALLQESGNLVEGSAHYNYILERFKGNNKACAAAKHNLATVLERQFTCYGPQQAHREMAGLCEASLALDSSRVYTRAFLVCIYLRMNKPEKAHKLLEASFRYSGFSKVMRLELEKSPDGLDLLKRLPTWAQNVVYPLRPEINSIN
jgi:tetratricopeptide (TPR) repeat protein